MLEHALFTYRFNLGHIESLVKDLTDDQMVSQPNGVINHPAWTLRHLASSSNFLAKTLGLESTTPAEWDAPSPDGPSGDAAQYPSKAELLAALKAQHERVAEAVAAADPEFLAKDSDEQMRSYFPKVGDLVDYMLTAHEGTHIGQISAWRRAMGLKPTAE
ncbi:MAG: DinB family protein [Acidobacteria bacterium]|nr:DinB family protein [Acidobacteriota bacterium]